MWPRLIIGGFVLAGLVWLVAEIREDGAQSVTTKIERQNNEAASRAHSKRTDYDSCLDAGRVWNFETGECHGS